MKPVALTIAGSDPSGGAGIQADLKTFHQFDVYGEAVIALLTVQNTRTVSKVEIMRPALVVGQLRAVLEDIPPQAAKTGALGEQYETEPGAPPRAGTYCCLSQPTQAANPTWPGLGAIPGERTP